MVTRASVNVVPIASSLDHVLGVKNDMLDRALVLKGEFAAEIERLSELKAQAERASGVVKTLDEAAAVRSDAEAAALAMRAEAQSVRDKAQAEKADVEARAKAVAERERAAGIVEAGFVAREDALKAERAKLDAESMAAMEKVRRATEANELRTANLAGGAADLQKALAALAAREKRLNERLEALKVADA